MTDRAGEAELLAQIYAAPDDDGPRLVYADWLQERGDPRGEFIGLQLERARGKARSGGRKREDALLAMHARHWEKPIGARGSRPRGSMDPGGVIEPAVEFGRGFPETVSTDAINGASEWSTVRRCNIPPADDRCHARALRVVTAARNQDISALATLKQPLAIEELAWGHRFDPARTWIEARDPSLTKRLIEEFQQIGVLPALRRLELTPSIVGDFPDPEDVAWVWQAPACARLEQLRVPGNELSDWIPALAPLPLARFELIQSVSEYGWQVDAQIIVERDASQQLNTVTTFVHRNARLALEALRLVFDALDLGVVATARIAITTQADWERSAAQRGALTRTLARKQIDATLEKASR